MNSKESDADEVGWITAEAPGNKLIDTTAQLFTCLVRILSKASQTVAYVMQILNHSHSFISKTQSHCMTFGMTKFSGWQHTQAFGIE